MNVRPKYQIFISSTYGDLRSEREAVTWAVLSSRHIPAGMENFSATDDRGWQTIKSVIDRSDYYVLMLAGRYGSLDVDGKSWTEKEYEYAVSRGIPVLAFIRAKSSITSDKVEDDSDLRAKLESFKQVVRDRHMYQEWATKEDLAGQVINALRNHIDDDEDRGASRPGWYRGDELPALATLDEFARLSGENARLHTELETTKSSAETVARLMLIDRDEKPVPSKVVRRRKLNIYHSALTSLESMARDFDGREDLALNALVLLDLGVKNVSGSVVEHVTVDFSLRPILGFKCGWHGQDLFGRTNLESFGIDPSYRNEYPDSVRLVSPEHLTIRFRIPNVPAGGAEYLPDLLAIGGVGRSRSYFDLTYRIAGSVGAPVIGSVRFETVFKGSVAMDDNAANKEKWAIQKGLRGAVDFKSMIITK